MRVHDKDCPGCETERLLREHGSAVSRDYLAWCEKCGEAIQGDSEHKAEGKSYHKRCVPEEGLSTFRMGER